MSCGKLINNINGIELCFECETMLFDIIKEYLHNNPSSNMQQVSEETSISMRIINQFIKKGRLDEIGININSCKLCGTIIDTDLKYCSDCLKKIHAINGLNNYSTEVSNKPKMHYLTKDKHKRR
jgi:hypothetical protein